MLKRAYSILTVKSVDEDQRIIEGVATTPEPDRYGDVVEPKGAEFKNPLPLLWQHQSDKPVGQATFGKPTNEGIPFKAKIAKILEPGNLKDRVDEAWQSVKAGLVRAVSIGFLPKDYSYLDGGGIHFLETEILELSLVTIPANVSATISTVKSIDERELRAASGRAQRAVVRFASTTPGASGQPKSGTTPQEGTVNIQEQIKALEAKRQAQQARLNAISEKTGSEGRTKDEAEGEEFKTLMAELKAVDAELVDLRELEKINVTRAAPVTPEPGTAPAERARGGGTPSVLTLRGAGLPKGTAFTRYVMSLAMTRGNPHAAVEIAKRWKDTPEVEEVLKAAVAAGSTTDPAWAGNLVAYTTMVGEFVELLRAATIIGKFGQGGIPSLRRVPFNIRMATQTGGGTYGWVGQGAAKPVGKLTLGEITLKWAKAAGIIVITDELARFSNPAAEGVVRNDMINGMAAFCDAQFVNPDVAEVADVSPASIFNGASAITATGTDADALRRDLGSLWDAFFAANLTPTTGVFIMSNRQAMRLSLMRNALGGKEFPDVNPLGGVLEGFPIIASEAVPDDSNGGQIGFVNADDIYFADDGPVTIDASREASLQMDGAPDEPSSASTVMVSLWQRNLIGLRAEVYRNWKKRRAAAANFIQGANYR